VSEDWLPLLSGPRADEALAAAHEVGVRLRDPECLAEAIATAPSQTSLPEIVAWRPISIAQGHSGLALTFDQLDACFPDERWGDEANTQIELAVEGLRRERRAPTGLFQGLAGLAFAAVTVDPARYARLLGTLDGLLRARAERLTASLAGRHGCADSELDVMSGLAGIGAYFLTRGDRASLDPMLTRLVELVRADSHVPAWHTPVELLTEDFRPLYPDGYLNCGLAHGIPGPLALLALAFAEGIEVTGLREAVELASTWLIDRAVEDEWGVNWAAVVPLGSLSPDAKPSRAAWCYGAPGISRALWLAGTALGDRELCELAVQALEAVFRRPPAKRNVDAPTFCHGFGGLLHVTLRMGNDSGSQPLGDAAAGLAAQLAGDFEPASIVGYRDLDPDGRCVDTAGLLQGAAGVALVLLAAAAPRPPRWDRLFLLA
jgi:lantibiotic modifying enzyme